MFSGVVLPDSRHESWTVVGDDAAPIEPVERYLAFLTDVARSPNTVKAYAHDLKDWFSFLAGRSMDWREVRLEDVGEFVAWLRLPPAARDGRVAVLPSVDGHCTEATINRKLSAVSAFYQHSARNGVELGDLLRTRQPVGGPGQRLASVPASHQQEPAGGATDGPVEDHQQAPAGAGSGRGAGGAGCLRPVA